MLYNSIILQFFIFLTILTIYGIFIIMFNLVLHKIGISKDKRIILSFLIFGITTGILIVYMWPNDVCISINCFTMFIGDKIYWFSILYLGDPNSPHAHYTIPWVLRAPQIYLIVSIAFWSLIGLLIQYIYNKKKTNLSCP